VRALVLAAGWARRLGSIAEQCPKPLLPVSGRTPLDFVVDAADRVDAVTQIDVVTHDGFLPRFEEWAGRRAATRARLGVHGNGTRRPDAALGAVGDLARFLASVETPEPFLVMGGDMVFDADLAELAAVARDELAIAVYDVGDVARVRQLASVELDTDARVRRFVEKDPDPTTPWAAPALYGLPADALGDASAYLAGGGERDNLGHLVEWWLARRTVRGVRLAGRWIDVGTPAEYQRARREFSGG
jgi:NDP-sugar pyrophosphorylase family protein